MPENTEKQIQQLQMIEQSLSNLLVQRQQFQSQIIEVDSALKELSETDKAYKIIGNIMVMSEPDKLKKDLESKKEVLELRVKNLEKQEKAIKEKATKIQGQVISEMKESDKDG